MNRLLAIEKLGDFFREYGFMTSQEFVAHPNKPFGLEVVRRLKKTWPQLQQMSEDKVNRSLAISQLYEFFDAYGTMDVETFCAHPNAPYGMETVVRLRKNWTDLVAEFVPKVAPEAPKIIKVAAKTEVKDVPEKA